MPDRLDPYSGFNFSVELDGLTRAGFRSCSGLESTTNAVTYREGTDRVLSSRKLPGLLTQGDVTLSRGITADDKLWKWREKVMTGQVERHNISISLLDDGGNAKITWMPALYTWPMSPCADTVTDQLSVVEALYPLAAVNLGSTKPFSTSGTAL